MIPLSYNQLIKKVMHIRLTIEDKKTKQDIYRDFAVGENNWQEIVEDMIGVLINNSSEEYPLGGSLEPHDIQGDR